MPLDTEYLDQLMGSEGPHGLPPICMGCGYNLTGLETPRCPECGLIQSQREWRRQAAELRERMAQVASANEWAGYGVKTALGGAGLWLMGILLGLGGGVAPTLGRLAGFICGLCAFFLGVALFRVHRLPEWARQQLEVEPNHVLAVSAILLGLTLVLLAVIIP